MTISDDHIINAIKEISANTKVVSSLAEKVGELARGMNTHIVDPQAHSGVIPRTTSLESSRRFAVRAWIVGAMGGAGGVASVKSGMLEKALAVMGF